MVLGILPMISKMTSLSFKNRIALNYIVGTGLLVLVVFSAIYFIVKLTVYNHIDENLNIEVQDHLKMVLLFLWIAKNGKKENIILLM